jgi:hypothetical protein
MLKLDSRTQQIVDFMHEGHAPSAIDGALKLEEGCTHDLWLYFMQTNEGILPPNSIKRDERLKREIEEMRAQFKAVAQARGNGYKRRSAQQMNRVVARRYAGRDVKQVNAWDA